MSNHCLWFYYFSYHYYQFSQILAYFFICVWLVPFGFFISLSANENVLPGSLGVPVEGLSPLQLILLDQK